MENAIVKYSLEAAKDLAKALASLDMKAVEPKGEGTFEVIASTESVDRDGEVIKLSAWKTDVYMKNPVVLWAHDYWMPPIGVVTKLTQDKGKLMASGVFANTAFGQEIRKLYDDGIIKAVSVGFIPKNRDGNVITEAELLELSFVPVPANADALSLRRFEDLCVKAHNIRAQTKTAVVPHETPKADPDTEWDGDQAVIELRRWASSDGSGEKDTMDWEKYRQGFAWFDENAVDSFEAYKLPHHIVVDGALQSVWRGVTAAMTALLGARGGVEMPEADVSKVYAHLAEHYKQFEQEPPVLEVNEEEENGADPSEDEEKAAKSGRVISSKNRQLIQTAVESMNESVKVLKELLEATEPEKTAEGTVKNVSQTDLEDVLVIARAVDKTFEVFNRTLKSRIMGG